MMPATAASPASQPMPAPVRLRLDSSFFTVLSPADAATSPVMAAVAVVNPAVASGAASAMSPSAVTTPVCTSVATPTMPLMASPKFCHATFPAAAASA